MDTKTKIVNAIKALGYNSRQVSVRSTHYSYEVTIRDPLVNPFTLEQSVKQFESVSRCEVTHEILSGGNTYINVNYAANVEAAWSAPYLEMVTKAINDLRSVVPNQGITVGKCCLFWQNENRNYIQIHDGYKNGWHKYNFVPNASDISLELYLIELKSKM